MRKGITDMPKPTAIYYFTNPNEDWKGINMKCSQKLAWKKKELTGIVF